MADYAESRKKSLGHNRSPTPIPPRTTLTNQSSNKAMDDDDDDSHADNSNYKQIIAPKPRSKQQLYIISDKGSVKDPYNKLKEFSLPELQGDKLPLLPEFENLGEEETLKDIHEQEAEEEEESSPQYYY